MPTISPTMGYRYATRPDERTRASPSDTAAPIAKNAPRGGLWCRWCARMNAAAPRSVTGTTTKDGPLVTYAALLAAGRAGAQTIPCGANAAWKSEGRGPQ